MAPPRKTASGCSIEGVFGFDGAACCPPASIRGELHEKGG
jgi:hypothetical protein